MVMYNDELTIPMVSRCVLTTALALLLGLACHSAATERYVSPAGSGSACTQSAPCTVQQCIAVAGAGDTCWFQDGRYLGDASMLRMSGKTGAAGQPITFAAMSDGKVLLDGERARGPGFVDNSSWVTIAGLNLCCAAPAPWDHTYALEITGGSHHVTVQRVIGWDADPVANAHVMSAESTTDVTFIDVAAWGSGRKAFAVFRDTRTTVLRGFFMKTRYDGGITDGGVAATYAYDSIDSRRYNVIATGDLAYGGSVQVMYGLFDKDHYGTWQGGPSDVFHLLHGNIGYHVDGQNVGSSAAWAMGLHMGCGQQQVWNGAGPGPVVHIAAANNLALRRTANAPPEGINGVAETCGGQNSYANWTDSVGSLQGGTHLTASGARPLSGFSNGLLNLGATTQPTTGAWLRYRYNADGSLSTTNLWPWPMNQRIADALVTSGYAQRGLDGQGEKDLTALIMRLTGSSGALPQPSLKIIQVP
jgi:hypothetical protein